MRLLDLFCGAGGCAMGYHQAGFTEIVGVDIEPQKRYPFEFVQGDALEYAAAHGHKFDAIHASPPCQFASIATPTQYRKNHTNYIPSTRKTLKTIGKPYIIENVPGARKWLTNTVMVCGTMLGLNLWRHRYFETWPFRLMSPGTCNHSKLPVLITGTTRRSPENGGRFDYSVAECREAADIDWMTRKELNQAIPPAYTEYIGRHLLAHIARSV